MWLCKYSSLTTSEQKGHDEIPTQKHVLQVRQVGIDSLCYKNCILNMESMLWHLTKCFYSSLSCILSIAQSHEYIIYYFWVIIESRMENIKVFKRAGMWKVRLQPQIQIFSSWCYSDFTQVIRIHKSGT